MIQNSFVFLEKISSKRERALWRQGIENWGDFRRAGKIRGIAPEKKPYYDRKIKEAQEAWRKNDSSFFLGKLPLRDTWRLYDYFREESGFLDIEIDSWGKIVLVGISSYYLTNQFVRGANLEKCFLERELGQFKLLITFNGSSFDWPKLRKQFQLEIRCPHIDLKPLCVNLGLRGGLKEVEKQLNLKRPPHLRGNPVELWKAFHASGEREWLDLLIEYNREDVENLKGVMDYAYRELGNKIYKEINLP